MAEMTEEKDEVTDRQRSISLGLLFCINLINYLDRMSISGVLSIKDPEKAGFLKDISFTQGGLLQTSFVISFMCFAPLFGYLGDRYSRKYLIVCGVLVWSRATFLCSFSNNYGQLLAFRALLGVGEASYATIAPAIIADMYCGHSRTKALALFYIGIPLGGALGYLGGVVGSLYGFRWAFRITPPIGVLLVVGCVFFLVDPSRGAAEGLTNDNDKAVGLRAFYTDTVKCFNVPSFTMSTLGFTAVTFATGALGLWGPRFIVDSVEGTPWKTSSEGVNLTLGAITAINGVVGTLCGVAMAQKLSAYTERAEPIVCLIGMLLAIPTCGPALFLFSKNARLAWTLLFLAEFGLCLNWALVAAILLSVVPPNYRALAQAIQILAGHVFGDAVSPYVVGAVSDSLVARGVSSSVAMAVALELCVAVAAVGAIAFTSTAYHLPADKAHARAEAEFSAQQKLLDRTSTLSYQAIANDDRASLL